MRQISTFRKLYVLKGLLLLLLIFTASTVIGAPTASADFKGDMQNGYASMPRELPDDASTYPGDARWSNVPYNQQLGRVGQRVTDGNSHQYITVGGGSVDDAGGNNSGNYFRTATFVVYTTNPGKKRLTFTFVDRRVNIEGDNSTCDAQIRVTPISQITGSGQGQSVSAPESRCGAPAFFGGGVDDRGLTASDFTEVTPINSTGTPYSTGVYKAYVHVRLMDGSGNQASFRIKTDSDARIGYSTEEFNTYGTRLINGHTISVKVRPPCNARQANNFTFSDADEQYPNIQPESAGGDVIFLRRGNQVGSIGFISTDIWTASYVGGSDSVPDSYEMRFRKIQGGNGITMGLPWESGNAYFTVCPPPPNDGRVEINRECTQVRVRPGNLVSDASRYQIIASDNPDMDRSQSGSYPRSPYWAGTANGATPPNTMLGFTSPGQPAWWNFDGNVNGVNRYKTGQTVYFYYIGYKDSSGRTIDAGSFTGPALVTLSPGDIARCYPPTWRLNPTSAVYHGGTSTAANYVELGKTVEFNHWVDNIGPDEASGFGGGMEANYNPDSPNNGSGTYASYGYLPDQPTPVRNQLVYSAPFTAGTTVDLLGLDYCQRYRIERRNMNAGALSNDTAISGPECVKVVGGKTSIGVGVNKSEVEPEETVTFTVDLATTNFTKGGYWDRYTATCNSVLKSGGAALSGYGGNCSQLIMENKAGTVQTVTYTVPSGTAPGTQLCLDGTLSTANINFTVNGSDSKCIRVVARPYFKVFGGDISAGNGFSGECVRNASVVGWNTNDGGSAYRGSGVQYAIYAQGVIKGVAPGRYLPSDANFGGGDPKKLAFGNGGSLAAGEFGGSFGSGGCANDYYSALTTLPNVQSWTSIAASNSASGYDRNFKASGPLVVLGTADNSANYVGLGNNTKLYVDGDVYINSNISAQTGAETIDLIPNFMLIAKGNIYIDKDVTDLFGAYVAQPKDNGSGGEIFTCSNRIANTTVFNAYADSQLYDNCQKQLKVTGSFVANKVNLQRTLGSLYKDKDGNAVSGSGVGNAAEVFYYNPLSWIRYSITSQTKSSPEFDAMTILPPVL